ncbi:trifunctional UDP-glucose 4,6-dehydratase/UDP-4-keto-6-deoxy-D-glucose 3,5-epimerase/UDP-4-keto-L-rhamnose-reductase RHM2 [Colletotrichum liriopes]|uniref:Trifunctional UDP-glucose 4,6-dehydratase/UDP-4-keto-6-deoxy-D-glucose 3,5-epimerase/UDP-4-keto-L-rhamnose-reductase RHM2 n=1 Tax=Colletotrichum liriopes TaxID=708192 RepID=A0AA37GHB0_9PEZI|nr:trifunctional UDP-glucose 4,6-dehydratase/UDP-4-keto-6-deoxy-D-glucose 3,5-epimerase/UDP-4-keto-L-rhamnose-reductase RHM2 [Colletotrichum liriopes]
MTQLNGQNRAPSTYSNGHGKFFQDFGVWKEAPLLKGTTKFEPLPDVKNIMITGGAGFISLSACWLVRHLTLTYPDHYNIVSFDKLDYCSSLNNTRVLNEKSNFTFVHGDITNPTEVVNCLKRYNIDTVFHFAAQSHVDLSFGNSYGFTHTNVYGTHVLLESAKSVNIKRFIHISTDEVYGEVNDDDDDLLETSILAPTNPYAASKAAAEMLVQSYQKSFKLPVIIVRSNNVYGPHQFPEKIIPKFTCLLNRGKPVVLHGDGSPTRRYLFAGDAADAFDTILHKGQMGQIYNPSSQGDEHPFSTTDEFKKWVKYTHDRPFNDHRYAVDGTKLRQLGWDQKTSFADGLRITVNWYRQFGEEWWGDISSVLTPFPVVQGLDVSADSEPVTDSPLTPESKKRKVTDGVNGSKGITNGSNGHAARA